VKKAHEERFIVGSDYQAAQVAKIIKKMVKGEYDFGTKRRIAITIRVELVDPPAAGGEDKP
jgi:hypothetical protein